MKKKVLIVGAFRFPEGDAAAKRVLGFGLYCREFGYDVEYLSWGKGVSKDAEGIYKGFKFKNLNEIDIKSKNFISKFINYIKRGFATINYLKSNNYCNADKIISYHGTSLFILFLYLLCKKRGIDLILDITEWYDPSQLPGGKFGLVNLDNIIRMRFVNPLVGRMIVISNYLYDFYQAKGCDVIRISFLIEILNRKLEFKNRDDGLIKLVYIGKPGKKDEFDIIIKSLSEINKEVKKITLDVYGVSKKEFDELTNYKMIKYIDSSFVRFHGWVPNKLIDKIYPNYDFSIILRPNKRYAKAGFPTKLVESLACGVPVIASNVGDIGCYIKSGYNGFLLDEIEETKLILLFDQILKLDLNRLSKMKYNSYNTAKKEFDMRGSDELLCFLNKV